MTKFNLSLAEKQYRLPFEVTQSKSIKVRAIIPSTKFSKGDINRNRYYINCGNLDAGDSANKIDALSRELWMPEAAVKRLHQELNRFGKVVFLGAGESRGKMAYRMYLGFSGNEKVTGNSAVSIDWVPETKEYLVKIYDELRAVPRETELKVLRECLSSSNSSEDLSGDQLAIYQQVAEITGKARGALHLTLIREEGGQRSSVSYNYYKVAYTANTDIRSELDTLAKIFGLSEKLYQAWFFETASLRIIDIAAGRAWNGELFVTIYHGDMSEPPPYYPDRKEQLSEALVLPTGSASGKAPDKPEKQSAIVVRTALLENVVPRSAQDKLQTILAKNPIDAEREINGRGAIAPKPTTMPSEMPKEKATTKLANAMTVAPSSATKIQLAYVVGTIGYDLITQARRDSIVQDGTAIMGESWNPNQPSEMLQYFQQQPWESEAVLWTLNQEETPIYAILPNGAYAAAGFERLRALLGQQLDGSIERVSIPGYLAGRAKLLNGQIVPVIIPAIRGIYGWTISNLVNLLYGERPSTQAEQAEYDDRVTGLTNFLDRIYYELRNLGTIPQERALNYAATNALQVANVYQVAARENTNLDRIEVEKSPLCRPESDCWDVKLTFFDPSNRTERARKVYRFTVDVSDVVPVTIGRVRSWVIY